MKEYVLLIALLLGLSGCIVVQEPDGSAPYGQSSPPLVQPMSPPRSGHLLFVRAAPPVPLPIQNMSYFDSVVQPLLGRFHLPLYVTATGSSDLPIGTVAPLGGTIGNQVFGWYAINPSNGTRCVVMPARLTGITTTMGSIFVNSLQTALQTLAQNGSQQSASPTRPTILSADFDCYGPINIGDRLDVAIRFYVNDGRGWVAQDFTLPDLVVQ